MSRLIIFMSFSILCIRNTWKNTENSPFLFETLRHILIYFLLF